MYGDVSASKASNEIVINEIAWMGTQANSADEWIELYNNTNQDINLTDWKIYEISQADDNTEKQTLIVNLNGVIKANSYYLIERSDDNTITDITASQKPTSWGGSGLNNKGERLKLVDSASITIDEINCVLKWFAGKASPEYKTMERKNPALSSGSESNWETNDGTKINGLDIKGNQIQGTPGQQNSVNISENKALEENNVNNTDTAIANNPTNNTQTISQAENDQNNIAINNNSQIAQLPIETVITEDANPLVINNIGNKDTKTKSLITEISNQNNTIPNSDNTNTNQIQNNQAPSAPTASIAKLLAQQNDKQTTPKTSQLENSENSSTSTSTNISDVKSVNDKAESQIIDSKTKETKPSQKERRTLILSLVSVSIIAFLLSLGLIYYRRQKT